jgi:transketolase
MAEHFKLDNLCGIIDVNRLGQSRATALGHDMETYARRWAAFGWHAIVVDGHDVEALLAALREARTTAGKPSMILAKTLKGKGISFIEGKDGWHGKAIKKGEELDRAMAELKAQLIEHAGDAPAIARPTKKGSAPDLQPKPPAPIPAPSYKAGETVATREAYGSALARLGAVDPRIVALDADVGNSTFSERFEKAFPDRFYQAYIAEQVMVGAGMGLASRGAIAFPSTFACFLSRAYDFIRMAGISMLNLKLAGSHAGVSIGEDGPSQMALEDLAMMRGVPNCAVVYPCDAMSAERLIESMAYHAGPAYMRTSRPKTPVIYGPDEAFPIGGCKVLRSSAADRATIVGAGVTLFEALKAHDELEAAGIATRVIDLYCLQPIDAGTLREAARATGVLVTVEDHYPAGGIGEAVASAVAAEGARVHVLAVREIPRSGKPDELIDHFGISARHIVQAVRELL